MAQLDQFGKAVGVGDKVQLKGSVVWVDDGNPNFVNCKVQLDETMPPAGTRSELSLNTKQLEVTQSANTSRRVNRMNQQIGQRKQTNVRETHE